MDDSGMQTEQVDEIVNQTENLIHRRTTKRNIKDNTTDRGSTLSVPAEIETFNGYARESLNKINQG